MDEAPTYLNALPLNAMLFEYRLESVLGAGGFGITYLAWDTNLEKKVAIKEYLPGKLAMRALDGSVVPVNTDHKYNYKWGLDRFVQEARTLAKFSHPNIVRVNRFFDANGTSYMVMDYEAGESLSQYLRRVPVSDEANLKSIVLPILDGLEAVHKAGFLHRDIKPSNVFMRECGVPVLLDFGAARMAAEGNSKSLTAIVSPGYAPLEQYSSEGNQGPWSDIYALAGVMYRAVTGEAPPDAVKRMKDDNTQQILASARGRFSEGFLNAISRGMEMDEKRRPQNVSDWRETFSSPVIRAASSQGAATGNVTAAQFPEAAASPVARADAPIRRSPLTATMDRSATLRPGGGLGIGNWLLAGIGIALLVLAILSVDAIWTRHHQTQSPAPITAATVTPEPAPKPESAQSVEPPPSVRPPQEATRPQSKPSLEGDMPAAVRMDFDRADNDANGYLTPNEVKGRFPFIERNFARVDADGDGRISAEEFLQLRKRQMNLRQRQ